MGPQRSILVGVVRILICQLIQRGRPVRLLTFEYFWGQVLQAKEPTHGGGMLAVGSYAIGARIDRVVPSNRRRDANGKACSTRAL